MEDQVYVKEVEVTGPKRDYKWNESHKIFETQKY